MFGKGCRKKIAIGIVSGKLFRFLNILKLFDGTSKLEYANHRKCKRLIEIKNDHSGSYEYKEHRSSFSVMRMRLKIPKKCVGCFQNS